MRARQLRNMAPEIVGMDDIVQTAAQQFFQIRHIVGIGLIPCLQGGASFRSRRPVRPQLFPRGCLVGIRKVAEEQKGKHIVAEVVRIHGAAQFVSDVPERRAQLFLCLFGHGCSFHGIRCSKHGRRLQTARKKPLHQALLVFPQGRCFCFLRFDALVKGRKTVGYFLLFEGRGGRDTK